MHYRGLAGLNISYFTVRTKTANIEILIINTSFSNSNG